MAHSHQRVHTPVLPVTHPRAPTHALLRTRSCTRAHTHTEENKWFLVLFHGQSNSQTRVNITVYVHCLSCHASRCCAVSVLMDHLLIFSHLWQRLLSRTAYSLCSKIVTHQVTSTHAPTLLIAAAKWKTLLSDQNRWQAKFCKELRRLLAI